MTEIPEIKDGRSDTIFRMAVSMATMSVDDIAARVVGLLIHDEGNLNRYQATLEICLEAFKLSLVPPQLPLSQAMRDVIAHRRHQIEDEGWTPEHDDADHDDGNLAASGAAYAINAADQINPYSQGDGNNEQPDFWMFEPKWWKPKDPRYDLVRGAALIVAEIEKMDRAAAPKPETCIACAEAFKEGDLVYNDVNGGCVHAGCLGPEQESYVGADDKLLLVGEPLPKPHKWIAPVLKHGEKANGPS